MTALAKTLTITDREFGLFQRLIQQRAGIYLAPVKKALLVGRLARHLRRLGLDSFEEYYNYLRDADEDEHREMVNCVCTNETRFFREKRHYEFLEREVYPTWRHEAAAGARQKSPKVWSAACSTGQEPYSLAMSMLYHLPPEDGWQTDILATDLSTRVLEAAEAGVYPIGASEQVPEAYLNAFMLRGIGSQIGRMAVGDELLRTVRFASHNLNDERQAVDGPFDLILCCNVLIYFDAPTKIRVVNRLLSQLRPNGYLLVGHSESLTALCGRVRCLRPTVYVHAGGPRDERQAALKRSA